MNTLMDCIPIEHQDKASSKFIDDILLVDDIDDFFQSADVTDEFDVSPKDSSIKEVILESATWIDLQ